MGVHASLVDDTLSSSSRKELVARKIASSFIINLSFVAVQSFSIHRPSFDCFTKSFDFSARAHDLTLEFMIGALAISYGTRTFIDQFIIRTSVLFLITTA